MYKLADNIYYDGDDENQIIADVSSGKFFELNSMSCELMKLIVEGRAEGEIVEFIVSKYNVNVEQAIKDVKAFIEQLIEMKIIKLI